MGLPVAEVEWAHRTFVSGLLNASFSACQVKTVGPHSISIEWSPKGKFDEGMANHYDHPVVGGGDRPEEGLP